MKRFACAACTALMLASLPAFFTRAAGRFDQKLSIDKQIIHVLNRLTFGPQPGDVEQVRRLGVEKWIDLQLHPDRITESPVLETRLKPLSTLQLANWQILEKYPAGPALPIRPAVFSILTPQQFSILNNCSADDRLALLNSLQPEMRRTVLGFIPPQLVDGLTDEVKEEAASARRQQQEERQKELRRLMPPLNELLPPDQIRTANRGSREEKLALFNSFDESKRRQVLRALPPQALVEFPDLARQAMALRQPQQFVNSELIENKLYRAIYSNRQLEEVLVDFWVNHFNVFNGKGPDRVLLTSFERDAIRPYVFGHFKDLLLATARHPAMLFYLDNWQSQVPRDDLPTPSGARRPGINENYGRELMELHTLGVDGGYTQDDVIAVARAFTGWTIYDPQKFAEFQFNPAFHDRKQKVILGHTLPPMRGEEDGLQVIDILAHHPSTAKFISKELAQRFVADDPPQSLIDRMADTFTKSDGDLRAVLQTMFTSVEFLSEGAFRSKLKSPLELTLSTVRALNAEVTDTLPLAQRIADLGEPLYGKVEPTGYPNTGEIWENTAGLLGRINFVTALVEGQIPGLKVDVSRFNFKRPGAVAAELLGMTPTESMISAIEKGLENKEVTPSILVRLIMSSPDFQKR
jgi:uncharacterized protein (DUF1800 family)